MGIRFLPPDGVAWPHVSKWQQLEWRHWCLQLTGWDDARFQQYWRERHDYGVCVQRKVGKKTEEQWLYRPSPLQVEFHKARVENLLFGGARGGAKSHALRWDVYKRCLLVPGYRAILFRRTFPELRDNHIEASRREVQLFGATYHEGERSVIWPNGSWLRYAHCENLGDEEKYLSSEYDWVGMDELATFLQAQAIGIIGSARSTKEGVTSILRASSNPGGAQTQWVVDRFMDHLVDTDDDPYYRASDWQFIGAKLYDNPHLMDPDGTFARYERRLSGLSPERRRQMLDGDWSAIFGQFFPEFRRDTHVTTIAVPPGTDYYRCLDWGHNQPGVCYWVARLPDGRLYVEHEYKFRETLAADVAKEIARRTKELNVHVSATIADSAMDSQTGAGVETIMATFRRYGVHCLPSVKGPDSRRQGAERFRHWLSNAPDGRPWMQFHPRCTYAIRSIPSLVHDTAPGKIDDVDTEGEDHAYDAIRYLVQAAHPPSEKSNPQRTPYFSLRWFREREARRTQGGTLSRRPYAA